MKYSPWKLTTTHMSGQVITFIFHPCDISGTYQI